MSRITFIQFQLSIAQLLSFPNLLSQNLDEISQETKNFQNKTVTLSSLVDIQ